MSRAEWRERKKAATRRAIQEHALRLFLAKGYEATTVEEIAAAAGVSHMTFFRHFPRKEAVVESDDYDPLLAELIAARPADEAPLTAIHRALRQALAAVLPDDREAILVRTRLVLHTPALRARNWQNQDATRDLFATALAHRDGTTEPDLRTQVLAAAALAALTTAITAWAEGDGAADLVALVDAAFTALGVPPACSGCFPGDAPAQRALSPKIPD
ncbi:MAG TPA: TetR family transcriptional regulator [Pseudonocardiaceae bacterium]|nr:TetR family transcriptional regulator [Pseudonocardiaceae bacterium]